MSDPFASVLDPAASAAADPPEDPPGSNAGFQGFLVTPQRREWVKGAHENSGGLDRAWISAPASSARCTTTAVSSGIESR